MKTLANILAVLAFGILLCGCRTVDFVTQIDGRDPLGTNVHGILTKPHETNEKPGKWKREDFPAIERCMVRGFTGNGLDERCAVRLVGVDGLTFTGNSITVGGNDASMQKAVPTPECGLIVHKLNHAVITGNRLVGTQQALLDLGEHGEQVILRDNVIQVKPVPANTAP